MADQNSPEYKIKVGILVRIQPNTYAGETEPYTAVVYEDNDNGTFRVQTADGTKNRHVPVHVMQPATQAESEAFLKEAPAELHPDAIIEREAKETGLTVEEFKAKAEQGGYIGHGYEASHSSASDEVEEEETEEE